MPVRRGAIEDDAFTFFYNTRTPGEYCIRATVGGAHMQGSPATVTASIAEAHAPLCEVVETPMRLSTIAGASMQILSLGALPFRFKAQVGKQ
jgi:hypothetical protein